MDEERCVDSCAGKLIRSNHRLMATYVQLMPAMVQKRMEELETKAAELAKAEEAQAVGAGGPESTQMSAPSPAPLEVPPSRDSTSIGDVNGTPSDALPLLLSEASGTAPDPSALTLPVAEVPVLNGPAVNGDVVNITPVLNLPLTVKPEPPGPVGLPPGIAESLDIKQPAITVIDGQNTPISSLPVANTPLQPSSVSVSDDNGLVNLQPSLPSAPLIIPAPTLSVPPPLVESSASVSDLINSPSTAPVPPTVAIDMGSNNANLNKSSQGTSASVSDSQS